MYPEVEEWRGTYYRDDGVLLLLYLMTIPNFRILQRVLCNEIFGEECFVAVLTVRMCNPNRSFGQDKYFATNHEDIRVCYRSSASKSEVLLSR